MYPIELQRLILALADVALTDYGEIALAQQLRRMAQDNTPQYEGLGLQEWLTGEGIHGTYKYGGIPHPEARKQQRKNEAGL